jgi:hypothetical protein
MVVHLKREGDRMKNEGWEMDWAGGDWILLVVVMHAWFHSHEEQNEQVSCDRNLVVIR